MHDPVTWYKITHAGEQVAQWDFQKQSNSYQSTLTCLCCVVYHVTRSCKGPIAVCHRIMSENLTSQVICCYLPLLCQSQANFIMAVLLLPFSGVKGIAVTLLPHHHLLLGPLMTETGSFCSQHIICPVPVCHR